jgi:hypothetical protein
MPMRGEISVRPELRTIEPVEVSSRSILELKDAPDFVVLSSFVAIGVPGTFWLAIKLPLVGMATFP